jgi:hypothetical protein
MLKAQSFESGTMVPGAGVSISAISTGFHGSFEFGVTDKIGVYPRVNYNDYLGTSLLSIDAWGSWHGVSSAWAGLPGGDKADLYGLLGPTFYSGDDSGFALGFGAGGRYYLTESLAIQVEGKYRYIFGDYISVGWYDIGLGVTMDL